MTDFTKVLWKLRCPGSDCSIPGAQCEECVRDDMANLQGLAVLGKVEESGQVRSPCQEAALSNCLLRLSQGR
ncbi:hypothetical protein NDU88_003671 [Pleurodeles waltl]|uniref:Uncharacterized protein n=1 Tax=Pleurodeles waltl TaxID=8319 RepID=A0AAV7QAB9_PLEWA|nr:hypothetical protein NDU88_003671 [Pleurodeles waltl]